MQAKMVCSSVWSHSRQMNGVGSSWYWQLARGVRETSWNVTCRVSSARAFVISTTPPSSGYFRKHFVDVVNERRHREQLIKVTCESYPLGHFPGQPFWHLFRSTLL
ncbi:unnamed protein product [Protopolystoma xenopodis]|uniref:Uncharacterized protein n=1 Tax=Protopolystoma xenopodis TaxID=117903 RepID=A0A3S4ZWH3_9PLAT|nr:unnamed protein product [Protopolystoma xenopodis]